MFEYLVHEWWSDGAGHGLMVQSLVLSDDGVVLVTCVEVRVELKGKALIFTGTGLSKFLLSPMVIIGLR